MALSFADSLQQTKENIPPLSGSQFARSIEFANNFNTGVNAIHTTDNWTLDSRYKYYPEYSDESMSYIDEMKNVTLSPDQINLTQEANSQFIPFQMPRYYDGYDLSTANLLIYFVNKNNYDSYSTPVNVYYSDSKIKFAWLVNEYATAIDGKVRFEIQAIGTNSNGDEYVWKTKPCDDINILRSLSGNGVIEPDHNWLTDFVNQINTSVNERLSNYYTKDEIDHMGMTVDPTLSVEGVAADAKTVGDTLAALPVSISDDGYSEVLNQRKVLNIAATKTEDLVNLVATLSGNKRVVFDIAFNQNQYPTSITVGDLTCTFSWSGF